MSVPVLLIALEIFYLALALIGLALIIAAVIFDAYARRTRDFLKFESRSVLAQRLMLAAAFPIVLDVLFESPLVGGPIALLVVAWVLWCIPRSRRRFEVAVEAVFASPPEAVASVMFDVSQQPRWMESVKEAVLETPGLLRVGSVIHQTVVVSDRDLVATLRVSELDPYRKLVLEVDARFATPTDVMEVRPSGNGSVVRYGGGHEMRLAAVILNGWRSGGLRRTFVKRRQASLERLRVLVEGAGPRAAASSS